MGDFPATRNSLVRRLRSADETERARAHETIAAVYWKPLYAYIRIRHGAQREDAEDLTQGFFAEALRRELFRRYEPGRAKFRTYVRRCVDAFVANERKAGNRLKRGGGAMVESLDVADLEERLATDADPDRVFQEEWVRAAFEASLDRLRDRCESAGRRTHFDVFVRHDVDGARTGEAPGYAAIADEFGLTVSQVTNWLSAVRGDFREAVLETLRELTGTDDELRDDARALLGIDAAS